ncbi:hypothetical protein BDL97_07G042900 [Sphagnum fallax]|nr:hypothetical protein BDL97_07G042900 [Sphagnum fallax]
MDVLTSLGLQDSPMFEIMRTLLLQIQRRPLGLSPNCYHVSVYPQMRPWKRMALEKRRTTLPCILLRW